MAFKDWMNNLRDYFVEDDEEFNEPTRPVQESRPTVASTPKPKVEERKVQAAYRPGETVKLHITPPFDGDVLLAIANERLIETYNVYVPATGATVEIPFRESWGVGAYVLATAFR